MPLMVKDLNYLLPRLSRKQYGKIEAKYSENAMTTYDECWQHTLEKNKAVI